MIFLDWDWILKQQHFQFSFTLLDKICPEWAIITKTDADLKRYRFREKCLIQKLYISSIYFQWIYTRHYPPNGPGVMMRVRGAAENSDLNQMA
jgi:hypothetical protein